MSVRSRKHGAVFIDAVGTQPTGIFVLIVVSNHDADDLTGRKAQACGHSRSQTDIQARQQVVFKALFVLSSLVLSTGSIAKMN